MYSSFNLLFFNSLTFGLSQDTLVINSFPNDTIKFCGDTVILDAGFLGTNYTWSNGGNLRYTKVFVNGTYIVQGTDLNSNVVYDTIFVSFNYLSYSDLKDTASCSGVMLIPDSSQLWNINNRFLWSTGDTTILKSVYLTGTYWVKISNDYCTIADTINYINLSSNASGVSQSVCGGEYIFNAGKGTNYLWSAGDTSQEIIVNTTVNYSLEIENEQGCKKTSSFNVNYIEKEADLINVPNAFSPNGDGKNDFFIVNMSNYEFDVYSFSVYNRWGQLMWETDKPNHKWYGYVKEDTNYDTDKIFLEGIYFYILKYKAACRGAKIKIKTGNIHVLGKHKLIN
jgi:gliding motility-associated-like protein